MADCETQDITRWLQEYAAGDREALDRLMPRIYTELRALADRVLRGERRDLTLGATALVHETYLRMIDQRDVQWKHRAHFLAIASQMMRRILVDHARRRAALKRGGMHARIPLDESGLADVASPVDFAVLNDALERLAQLDPRQAKVVELRFFGGMTVEDTAEVLDLSPATVKREWTVAKAWLHRTITGDGEATTPDL